MATETKTETKTTKSKKASLQDAAEAFVLLHDSGNYSSRDYDLVLGALREAALSKDHGPYVPEDEADEEADAAVADRIAEIQQLDEEGALTPSDDGGRKLAEYTKAKAEETKANS